MFRDLRRGGEDVAVAVSYQKIAVGDYGGSSIHADENVHPVVIFPQVSNLHRVQVGWLTQGVYYVFADYGLPLLTGYRLVNRHRVDVTDRYPELGFLANLPAGIILDGEIVVLRQGKPDFGLLLSRNHTRAPLKIRSLARMLPATYVVFDLLYQRFESLLALPLGERRERLEKLMRRNTHPRLVFSQGVIGSGKAFFAEV